jgi:Pyruvate/2-oxoacid:ferredoxin oxidoreductase delta subunit
MLLSKITTSGLSSAGFACSGGELAVMSYQHLRLYVMSGTGNTYRVASWMAAQAEAQQVAASIHLLDKYQSPEISGAGEGELLGFLMPAHGFIAPWQMIRFVLGLPRAQGQHAFVVATRAGSMFGPVRLPGMEGTTCYLIALLLALKGYRIRGVKGIDMPSNWTALHWGMNTTHVVTICAHAQPKAEDLIIRLLAGRRFFSLGGFICLIIGLLLLPISLAYLLIGRFFLAKLFFANNRCNGCSECAKHCSSAGVRMWRGRPFWNFSCESCMRCMAYCPTQAVEAGHSWGVLLYYAVTVSAQILIFNRLAPYLPWLKTLNSTEKMLLVYPYTLLAIVLSYLLFSLLIRNKFVNALFTYTTFTHLYRRYHEPATKLHDLHPQG